jgi:hypothetical protein
MTEYVRIEIILQMFIRKYSVQTSTRTTATQTKNIFNVVIFWDIVLCNPDVYRRFGGKLHLLLQG